MMIRRSTSRRPGLSLMEVLVGFGILGIAVPCVITLFPFSALTLGDALKNDRSATCAVTADGFLRDVHRGVVEGNSSEFYFQQLDASFTASGTQPAINGPGPDEPSTPVLIDPMGVYARGGANAQGLGLALGDNQAARLPRTSLQMIESSGGSRSTLALRLCSQLDGLSFAEDGSVPTSSTMSEVRYNWLWVVQRPVNRNKYNVRMQVVVFNGRANLYAPVRSEAVFGPATGFTGTTAISFTPGETSILNVPATAEVRKGGWVMDATLGSDSTGRTLRHAEFYRVLSVSDAANGTFSLEVHKPISRPDGQSSSYTGTLVSMPLVTDVFERPMLTAGTGP